MTIAIFMDSLLLSSCTRYLRYWLLLSSCTHYYYLM